jgi:hypothetical protein
MERMTSERGDQPGPPLPRIGDAERQAAVDALKEHYVAGRLNDVEFNERLDAAMEARTSADLRPLFSDLPPIDSFGEVPAHSQAMVPVPPPYVPVYQQPPAGTPATTGGRGRVQTLQLVRTLVWPVAIVLVIFAGANFWPVIGAAILTSIIVNQLLQNERGKQAELPPGTDEHSEGPGGPDSPPPPPPPTWTPTPPPPNPPAPPAPPSS